MNAPAADPLAQDFVRFAVDAGVLRFGQFKTKAGRMSPYFFNAGLFDDGAKLGALGSFYARRLLASGMGFDMLFGPAYKGITLAASLAIELSRLGRNVPFAFNRKEAKDHARWRRRWPSSCRVRAATCPSPSTARRPRTTAKAACWSAPRCAGAFSSSTT